MQRSPSLVRLVLASLLLLGLGAVATAQAQRAGTKAAKGAPYADGGAGYFAIGAHSAKIGALNDRLEAAGYPTFAREMISIGGGGYGVVAKRLLLGGEGHGLMTSQKGFQSRDVSVGGGYGLFTLGYLFRPRPKLRVYPQLGIGGGGLQLDIGSAGTADDFDEVLDDPNRSSTLAQAGFLIRLGGGVRYQFGPPGRGGFQLGLQAGYLLSTLDSDWQLDDSSLSGGPDSTMQGPFVQLTIGGGGGGQRARK
jgi:hypothetical protein